MLLINNSGQFKGIKQKEFKSEKEIENIVKNTKNMKDIVNENLWMIGEQMSFDNKKKTLDFLAIDKRGNLVVIELKKSLQTNGTNAETQTIVYASALSCWNLKDIKKQVEDYVYKKENRRVNFEIEANKFLDVDLSYINQDQRIIIVGSKNNESLDLACDWLYKHGIDVAIYKLEKYIFEGFEFIVSYKAIPGRKVKKYGPNLGNHYNQKYHLNKCSYKTEQIVKTFVKIIEKNYDLEGPDWSNKTTVTFSKDEKIIMKFRINKESIYITVSNLYNNPINIKKIIEEMSNKLDFGIKDKINLSNNRIFEKIDFQNE